MSPVAWDQRCVCGDMATYHEDRPGLPSGGPCNLCCECSQFTAPTVQN